MPCYLNYQNICGFIVLAPTLCTQYVYEIRTVALQLLVDGFVCGSIWICLGFSIHPCMKHKSLVAANTRAGRNSDAG